MKIALKHTFYPFVILDRNDTTTYISLYLKTRIFFSNAVLFATKILKVNNKLPQGADLLSLVKYGNLYIK